MEASPRYAHAPDFRINNDPEMYLKGTVYLDPADPIDGALIAYQEAAHEDDLPSAAQQRVLIAGLKNDNLASARELVESHRGLIAAVAYPFKDGELTSADLMHAGIHAFIQAAKSYGKDDPEFSDYAAAAVHEALGVLQPELAGDSFVVLSERPMEGVYRFLEKVVPADTPTKLSRLEEHNEARRDKRLTAQESQALELLHLAEDDMAAALGKNGLSLRRTREIVRSVRLKLGAETNEEAALIAFHKGIKYDIRDIPGREHFTLEERLVATRLWMTDASIMEELELSEYKVRKLRISLEEKTNARSRAEVLLMARMNDFEPSDEELNPAELSFLERLDAREKKVIGLMLYMSDKDIAEQPGVKLTPAGVNTMIDRVIRRLGIPNQNRTALILELHEQGMEFDTIMLSEPLSDLLYADELDIARHLDLPYDEIEKELKRGYDLGKISRKVRHAKRKTGARSRQELALVVRLHDDRSEALKGTPENNEWRLARYLGRKTLEGCNIEALLDVTTERQKELITAYYLSGEQVTWEEISEQYNLRSRTAHSTAARGIARMIAYLESEEGEQAIAA